MSSSCPIDKKVTLMCIGKISYIRTVLALISAVLAKMNSFTPKVIINIDGYAPSSYAL